MISRLQAARSRNRRAKAIADADREVARGVQGTDAAFDEVMAGVAKINSSDPVSILAFSALTLNLGYALQTLADRVHKRQQLDKET